jgi:N-acetyl-gamma-glutamyl-phosphate reductase
MHKYEAKTHSMNPVKVSVVGARGYSGLELVKLLLKHPGVELTHAYASQKFSLTDDLLITSAAKVICGVESDLDQDPNSIVFLATPAEFSMKWAPKLVAQGKQVIDLSGAFRLKQSSYSTWYGFEHTEAAALKCAVYGLCPFTGAWSSPQKLIANPGCYATAAALALVPLLKKGLIETDHIVIDAKSGTTGAGRKASEALLFSEVDGECLPYKVGKHQHLPEIVETVKQFTGATIEPHFTTHLLPVKRGIIASVYATSKTSDIAKIAAAYEEVSKADPLFRHGTKISQLAAMKQVVGTAYSHVSYELVGNKLYVFSVIDNLMKGAASQAVENLNRVLDLPTSFALSAEG